MAGYTVLANRFRPRVFADVVGQEDAARVLQGALRDNRAAHAFLFSGPRGVGKTSMARILAKAFNCLENESGDPCGSCQVCSSIDQGVECFDVEEIDGASHNRVENVRELIERLRFAPVQARFRITIVDEVHMLSTAAFNALLKTLEEPPSHAKFILATTEPLKVPETIRSRCQILDFRRLTAQQIASRLAHVCEAEGVSPPPDLLSRVARHAQGGMRDALTLLDQLITFGEGTPRVDDFERLTGRLSPELLQGLLSAVLQSDTATVQRLVEQALEHGARPADLLGQLVEWLEGVLVTCAGGTPADRGDQELASLSTLAAATNVDHVVAMLDILLEAQRRLRQRHDGQLVVEMALINMARLEQLASVAELLASGAAATGSTPAAPSPKTLKTTPPRAAPAAAPPAAHPASTEPQAQPADKPVDFRTRFLEEIGSRSLRLELLRYSELNQVGDELVLSPPQAGPPTLYDPGTPEVAKQLLSAAEKVCGERLKLRINAQAAGSAGGAPIATASQRGSAKGSNPVDQRVRELWPDAESVDG